VRAPTAILFDVGGTLLEEAQFDLAAAFREVAPVPPARAGELAARFLAELEAARADGREIPLGRWLAERALDGAPVPAGFEQRLRDAAAGSRPLPGAAAFLRRAHDDGVPLAAVSNSMFSAVVIAAVLARHDLLAPLAFVLSSADFGLRKPAPGIFRAALDLLELPAAGTWFVGDSFENDVVGAAWVGLQPVWLSDQPDVPELPGAEIIRARDFAELTSVYAALRRP
jgi:putative hydrolase of the HAD superfamily